MIINDDYMKIWYSTRGKIVASCKKSKIIWIKVKCDNCGKEFEIEKHKFKKRVENLNEELCGQCAIPKLCSLAAKKGIYNKDGTLKPNSGRFSSERVKALSKDEYKEYCKRRKKIALDFHKTLENDPKLKEEYYKKIFKNSRIGYISKAQKDIAKILEPDGFLLEQFVEGMMCDVVNFDKKIIIEYNGDLFHANPRKYKPDDYIEMIKMTAKEKWAKDRAKNFRLRRYGYQVIVIWENEWNNDRKNVLKKFQSFKNKDWKLPNWWEVGENTKTKKMSNNQLNKNKYVPIEILMNI